MPDINDLRQARAEQLEKVQALAALEADGTELSAEQLDEFVTAQAEFESLSAKIERAEKAEQMTAKAAKPVPGLAASGNNYIYAYEAEPKKPEQKGAKMARLMQTIGAVGRGGRDAAHYADTVLHDAEVAAALNTTTGSAGGVLVPQAFMSEVIELLSPMAVVRSFDPIILPMPNGNASIPRIVNGATSNYIGESVDIPASEQEFGDLELSAKNLATLVPVSNQLLNYNGISPALERVLIGDMLNSMALREDLAFIRGDGANNTPKGFRSTVPTENLIAAGDGSTIQLIEDDLAKLESVLLMANVKMLRPGWVMSPRTALWLSRRRDGNGNKAFPEMANGMLGSYPFRTTTQVPANLGAGTESEIYLADFANAVIGESGAVTVAMSTEASYVDPGTGSLVSAFSRNQSVMRVVAAHDFGMRHAASAAVLTGVTWGA